MLQTDASEDGHDAAMYQVQEGTKRVIAYGSRTVNEAEKRYLAYHCEFLALKWAVTEKFKVYLYDHYFHVSTDSNTHLHYRPQHIKCDRRPLVDNTCSW